MGELDSQNAETQRFICYLALKEAVTTTPEMLCEAITAHFPGIMEMLGRLVPKGPISEHGQGFLIEFGGTPLAVLFMSKPLPPDAWQRPVELDRVWPKAGETMAAHGAHAIVSNVDTARSHGEALMLATKVTLAAAALASMLSAQAVVWAAGETIVEPQRFIAGARGFENKQIPTDLWMGLTWLDGPPTPKGERTFAVLTSGLLPFVGREIEFMPAALPPVVIAQRLLGAAQYLIVSGPVLTDGDNIGVSDRDRIRVHLVQRGQRLGIPVYQFTLELLAETWKPTAEPSSFGAPQNSPPPAKKPVFGKKIL